MNNILPLELNPPLLLNLVPQAITEVLPVNITDTKNLPTVDQEDTVTKSSLVDSITKIIATGSHTQHQIAYECNLR